MATTSGVGNTYMGTSYEDYQKHQREIKNTLGKNDFLNLLVAQMQYQDPLEPTKDSDFVAQLAQFSSLEQMENMSSSMAMMQAHNLVGKYVCATDVQLENGGKQNVAGLVEAVFMLNGEYFAKIGDLSVKISKITEVYDKEMLSGTNPLLDYANLLGCTVSGNIIGKDGNLAYEQGKAKVDADGQPVLDNDGNPVYEQGPAVVKTGVVIGIGVENGTAVAYIKTDDDEQLSLPLSLISDIRREEQQSAAQALQQTMGLFMEQFAQTQDTETEADNTDTDPAGTESTNTEPVETASTDAKTADTDSQDTRPIDTEPTDDTMPQI